MVEPAAIPAPPSSSAARHEAGHTLQFVASLISHGAQIVTIRHSNPFVLI